MIRFIFTAALGALSVAVAATAATAQGLDPSLTRRAVFACSGDALRLCASVPRGEGRIARCLMSQPREQLTSQCRSFVEKAALAQQALAACADDAARHCAGVEPGEGRVVTCLFARRDVLSASCAASLDRSRAALAE